MKTSLPAAIAGGAGVMHHASLHRSPCDASGITAASRPRQSSDARCITRRQKPGTLGHARVFQLDTEITRSHSTRVRARAPLP